MLFPLLLMARIATDGFAIPHQYQKNTTVILHEMTQKDLNKFCNEGQGPLPPGWLYMGCQEGNNVYITNPCLQPDVKDTSSYENTLCHEIAHTEGWVHPE